jgi:ubiquinone/menaquinone biosynthesis C-methylase UbiE
LVSRRHISGRQQNGFHAALQNLSRDLAHAEELAKGTDFIAAWNQTAEPFEWTKSEVHPQNLKHTYCNLCNSEARVFQLLIPVDVQFAFQTTQANQQEQEMATIEENKRLWNGEYKWKEQGDEWSVSWGGPSMQWYGTLLPRIHAHVPTNCILEIACGYGRWTRYLKDSCKDLIVVDLSDECITACQRRFADFKHIKYYVNDGKSLPMVPDASVDLVFSFDSLVHANDSVLNAYIREFSRILTDKGIAFIHHSNLGEYHAIYSKIWRVPKLAELLARLGFGAPWTKNEGWRDLSVDAKKVAKFAEQNGLRCISQEIIPWPMRPDRGSILMTDCISTIGKDNSAIKSSNVPFRNYKFIREIQSLSRLSKIYIPG